MDKKKIITVAIVSVAVAAVAVGGYIYWRNKKAAEVPSTASSLESAVQAGSDAAGSATQGVLPSLGEAANPLQNKPDVNPVGAANPFKAVQTNPFE